MERYKVVESTDQHIVFCSIDDMENAYHQLADGKDIIVFTDTEGEETAEIISGKKFSDIMDGKYKLNSKAKKK